MGYFLAPPKVFVGVWSFCRFNGVSPYGETYQTMLWRGNSTLKKWIVYFFFYFLNLARLYSFIILLCFHMSLLLFRSIVFLKFEHDQIIIYVHNFFLYFEYDGFLTQFRMIVVLITHAMQVCEFCCTGFIFI